MKINLEAYNKIIDYIDKLILNQNNTLTDEYKNILTKKDYYALFKDVLNLINKNVYTSIGTIRHELFLRSKVKDSIDNIVNDKKLTPGLVLNFGTMSTRDIIISGNKEEYVLDNFKKVEKTDETEYETIYDLASTSKLFTSILIYKLSEYNFINLEDPITKYAPNFKNLKNVSIYDLLKFKTNIITTKRIDEASNVKEAEEILFNSIINPNPSKTYAYTDIGVMVLKHVIEGATNTSFHELASDIIFKKANMTNTFLEIPYEKINLVASNNFNSIVNNKGGVIESYTDIKGISHDPKAKIIKELKNNAPGHAGYFSNTPDMVSLSKSLINNEIISQNSLLDISNNLVGCKLNDDNYSWYFGSLVFLKQPNGCRLPLDFPLSGKAFASPGFGGTFLCIDPLNETSIFIGANRLHNRIYKIPDKYNLSNKYEGQYISQSYAEEISTIVKRSLTLAIQYKFLEMLYENKKEHVLIREI